jgi:hypothetical protein
MGMLVEGWFSAPLMMCIGQQVGSLYAAHLPLLYAAHRCSSLAAGLLTHYRIKVELVIHIVMREIKHGIQSSRSHIE